VGRTACAEPQFLYKGALYFYLMYHCLCIGSRHYNMEAYLIRFVFDCVPILCRSHDVSIATFFLFSCKNSWKLYRLSEGLRFKVPWRWRQ